MKKYFATYLIVILGLAWAVSGQSRGLVRQAEWISGDRFNFAVRTPRGAAVYAVNRPSAAMLRAIDSGLTDLFNVAGRNGYMRGLSHYNYTIFVARADRQRDRSGNYSPDIAVGAAQYAGSDYDQGGFIYAAGMVLSFSPGAFIIAEHSGDLGRVSQVVRYEGEHIILYQNDRNRFAQTQDHSRGGGHPILQ